jgi:choline-sulfatase
MNPRRPGGNAEQRRILALAGAILVGACDGARESSPQADRTSAPHPSILLVTLDTTRADAIGPEARGIGTPSFNALAARGRRFRQAYATVPETLPSHSSMMTGLYPAGHSVRENARYLPPDRPVLAERLAQAGYRTEAFVSSFVLARRFGLARGFSVYDDELAAGQAERASRDTTDRAVAHMARESGERLFLWVHYFDPHAPYSPPEPFRSLFAKRPYLGEVAAMDEQLGRLVRAFELRVEAPRAILVVGDHGEGLGDHGESQHGNLVYQSTMHVPLLLVGPGVAPGVSDTPVSTRRVFHTVLDWAGLGEADSLRGPEPEIVLGEAMKPFLSYGWQPQVMAVEGRRKAILAGKLEVYDVVADPAETRDLGPGAQLSRPLRTALREYPVPSLQPAPGPDTLGEDERRKLASLGYVAAGVPPVVRKDAPRPADMARLFPVLDEASTLFVRGEYARVIPLLERIRSEDPGNLDAALRLATAHSALGHEKQALAMFERAGEIAPGSQDVRTYLALHYARGTEWPRAAPLLEQVVAEAPDRLPALEALALVRERQGRIDEALSLRQRVYAMRSPTPAELLRLGQQAMSLQKTPLAIESFEKARSLQERAFANDLELGVLYLAARRLPEAREALDRVPASHPGYPMALFKRAQVSVLLNEPDQASRVEIARQHADATTRPLIASERLFLGAPTGSPGGARSP